MNKCTMMLLLMVFISSKTPMMYLVMVMSSCLTLAFLMVALSVSYWLGLMLIMVYVSGIMVMFMYMASLVPNEKSMANHLKLTTSIILANLTIWVIIKLEEVDFIKMSSSYMANLWWLGIMLLMILMSSTIPPKTMNSSLKGMKSSK